MLNNKELLDILRCPESHQPLKIVEKEALEQINNQIENRLLFNRSGKVIDQKLSNGLITNDGRILYPIMDDIPVLLIDEGIVLQS